MIILLIIKFTFDFLFVESKVKQANFFGLKSIFHSLASSKHRLSRIEACS